MAEADDIRALASRFRDAIEQCPRSMLPIAFEDFPRGSCGDAALLLAKYLERNGHGGFTYVLGLRDGCSHAWLRRGDLIVDITADQFPGQDLPVIVSHGSVWHNSFRVDPRDTHHADFERYDAYTAAVLAAAYFQIKQEIQ